MYIIFKCDQGGVGCGCGWMFVWYTKENECVPVSIKYFNMTCGVIKHLFQLIKIYSLYIFIHA